jgi:CO/xanthine dehydrogenase FAD-binding subunit
MFEMRHLVEPQSLEEAYSVLVTNRHNRLLGGCAFLKMGHKLINHGIDLRALKLDTISRSEGWIDLGATCTYGDITNHEWLKAYAGGLIPQALNHIVGVQLRNGVQVGASIFSKYGFSDFIPALLAVGAEVTLFHNGRMPVADFLVRPISRDILVAVHLPDHPLIAAYQSLRLWLEISTPGPGGWRSAPCPRGRSWFPLQPRSCPPKG